MLNHDSDMLGHEKISTTADTYQNLSYSVEDKFVNLVADLIRPKTGGQSDPNGHA